LENLKERDHSEDIGVDARITSASILRDRLRSCGLDLSGSGQGSVAVFCEPLSSIKGGEFII
jgi:hypothetical protein